MLVGRSHEESRMLEGNEVPQDSTRTLRSRGGYRKTVTMFLEWAQGEHSHYRPVHPTIQQIAVPGK